MVAGGSVQAIQGLAVSGPTPRIKCSINQNDTYKSWANQLTDFGCTIIAAPSALADKMKLQVEEFNPDDFDIGDARGCSITINHYWQGR